jgi:hypothetical protein
METYANGLRDAGVNNLTTAEVPDAGHFTTEEQPAQAWQIIDEFARGVGTRWQRPTSPRPRTLESGLWPGSFAATDRARSPLSGADRPVGSLMVFCVIAGPDDVAVDESSRWRELVHYRGRVGVVRVVEHPAQEVGAVPQWCPSTFGYQEPSPLFWRQVLCERRQDAAFFVLEMVAEQSGQFCDRRNGVEPRRQGAVNIGDGR